ncbi:MAG: ABC transporter permease [Actinomycetes bacterium]
MSAFTGTTALVRLALRRDRVLLPVWLAVFVAMAASSAAATIGLYPTLPARLAAAEAANATPALVALYGPVYDPTSLGGIAMLKMTAFGAVLVAVLMVILVVRHTRAEEEQGRLELLGAGVVGRYAPLTAALLVAAAASVLLGALTAASLAATGLPLAGSVAFGVMWAVAGITFAAVAGLAAQLTESTRAATGIALVVLGVAYVLRAFGDVSSGDGRSGWLSWLSPIGWAQQIRPYAGDRFHVAVVPAVFVVLLVLAAFALSSRRDVGAGLVRPRLGAAGAGRSLAGPVGLAWRLQRGVLVAWLVAFALLGAMLGSMASSVGGFLESPAAREMVTKLGGVEGLTDAFLSTEFGFLGVIVSAYGISAAMRLRSEETALRAEPVLATGVSRLRWATSHLLVALAGTTLLLLVVGLAVALVRGAQTGDVAGALGALVPAALVWLPAAWVLTGIVVLLFGVAPRLVVGAWVALVAFLVIGEFGSLLGFGQAVLDVSPFTHVPRLPGADFSAAPLVWLTVVAAALVAVGLARFRRRDVG